MSSDISVLILQDPSEDADPILRALRRDGYDPCHRCVDNPDALKYALEAKPWDVILCDYAMRDLRGAEVLRIVRNVYALDVPIIFIGDVEDQAVATKLIRRGAQDCVPKSNFTRLPAVIEREIEAAKIRRESMETRQLLNEERFLLRQLMENIPDAVYFKDLQHRHVRLNTPSCRILNATRMDDLIGKTAENFIPGERHQARIREEKRIFSTGKALVDRVEKVVREDGESVWLSATKAPIRNTEGKIIGLVGITRDISLRMSVMEKYRIAEERLHRVLDIAADGIIALDETRTITVFNKAAEGIFGYQSREVVGRRIDLLLPPDVSAVDDPEMDGIGRAPAHSETSARRREVVGRRKGGETFAAEVEVSKCMENGKTVLVAVVRDVTEKKKSLEERDQLQRRLRQAEKMKSLGTLAGGIAHEFNNLLAPIVLLTEMAMIDLPRNQKVRKNLSKILVNSERATELIGRILSFSRTDEPSRKPVRLRDVVREAIELLATTLPSSLTILEEFVDFDDIVSADESQLHQVLVNLGSNAADAMKGRVGELVISIGNTGPYSERATHAVLSVHDTGCGIDRKILPRIFEPFFTTKPVGEGAGMGLSIIHGIIEAHGGHIHVRSAPGKGTTFYIALPLLKADARNGVPALPVATMPLPAT